MFGDKKSLKDTERSLISETVNIDGTVNSSGAIDVAAGTTALRPGSPSAGMFRYNSTDGQFEGYTTSWGAFGGGCG